MAFKLKGHTLPGIKQRTSNDLDDGRSGSAAFQQSDDPFAGSGSNKEKNNDGEFTSILPSITTVDPIVKKVDTKIKQNIEDLPSIQIIKEYPNPKQIPIFKPLIRID